MFRENKIGEKQMSFKSAFSWMSEEHRRMLEEGWAGFFRENILKNIDESPYSVLYSTNGYSRPNVPVNVMISMMLLEALLNRSETSIRRATVFDMEVQYALGIENLDYADVSERTLERFRQKCIKYEMETGVDLIHNTIIAISEKQADLMGLNGEKIRMDSLMVNSYIRNMGRLELIFQVIQNLVFALAGVSKEAAKKNYKVYPSDYSSKANNDEGADELKDPIREAGIRAGLPDSLLHYLNPYDKNVIIYHNERNKQKEKMDSVLADAMTLHELCKDKEKDLDAYKLFERVINEQCRKVWYPDENDVATIRRYELRKSGEGMGSGICQNPSDPEATYRKKADKEFRGYIANIAEQSSQGGTSLIREYVFDTNNVSDDDLGARTLESLGPQEGENKTPVVVDGAFAGKKIEAAAEANGFELVHTALNGKPVKDCMADHEFTEDGTELKVCAGGQSPMTCSCDKNGVIKAAMDPATCKKCPYYDDCHPKETKDKAILKVSEKQHRRALEQRLKKTGLFTELSRFRNGVETIPSLLRRRYNIDTLPIRGVKQIKVRIGIIVGAVNFVKCLKAVMPRVKCA